MEEVRARDSGRLKILKWPVWGRVIGGSCTKRKSVSGETDSSKSKGKMAGMEDGSQHGVGHQHALARLFAWRSPSLMIQDTCSNQN